MAKKIETIQSVGGNDTFFERRTVTEFDANTKFIVEDYQNAVLIKNGVYMETLGQGAYPAFDKKGGLFGANQKDSDVLSVDIVYMSKTVHVRVLWGTRTKFDFRDDETGVSVKVGASGEFEVQVCNPKKFYLSLVGADRAFTVERLKERLCGRMLAEIEPAIAKTMREQKISYTRISEFKPQISQGLTPEINKMFENDYGLKIYSFTLSTVLIGEECIAAIEQKRQETALEAKDKAKTDEDKLTAKEIAAEMERLNDKKFDREMLMHKLETENYEKYLQVCKLIGWDVKSSSGSGQSRCPKCGSFNPEGARFCNDCGEKLIREKSRCPKCNTVNGTDAKFCNNCGEKL